MQGSSSFPARHEVGMWDVGKQLKTSYLAVNELIPSMTKNINFEWHFFPDALSLLFVQSGGNFINILHFSEKVLWASFILLQFGFVIFGTRISAQKLLVKCWRNWLLDDKTEPKMLVQTIVNRVSFINQYGWNSLFQLYFL
jgi:hypothetical protein